MFVTVFDFSTFQLKNPPEKQEQTGPKIRKKNSLQLTFSVYVLLWTPKCALGMHMPIFCFLFIVTIHWQNEE
jgi:hypothetical protein